MAFLEQLKKLVAGLSAKQRLSLIVAAVAVVAGLVTFLRWRDQQDYHVLYSDLAAEDAAQVVTRLKEAGAEYQLEKDGAVIKVRSERLADLRLQLAATGTPKTGRMGFELFDQNNFGATQFAEQVNYHRALEGELERSVMTISEVESARVHITPPKESLFVEEQRPAKASVLLRLRTAARPSAQNIQAITQLVSSAVEGLSPEMISVLDSRGNLLNRARREEAGDPDQPSEFLLDYRRTIERDLIAKINGTLEPLLGPEKFRAGVSVECDVSTTEQSEEAFDPARSVMATSQRTEDIAGGNQAAGVPGAASNLPRPTSRPGSSGSGMTRRTENIAYQSSRMIKKTRTPQGQVRRVSVSVLLDHNVRYEGTGPKARRIVEPPSPERMKATRDLIAGIVGLQPERGDQLIVEALPFESTLTFEPPPVPLPSTPQGALPAVTFVIDWGKANPMIAASVAGGILVTTLLGGGVFWFLKKRRKKTKGGDVAVDRVKAIGGSGEGRQKAPGESIEKKIESQLQENRALKEKQELEILSGLRLPESTTKKSEVLAKHMTEQVKKDPAAFAHIIRTWMSDAAN
ncbi:MAG: flagellar basal-body MS-ring/collar protein FliF [Acidobacteriota bacterium]